MKKLICMFLLIAMTFSAAVCVAEQEDVIRYTYRIIAGGTAEIIGCKNASGDVVIPSELDGIPVTSIGMEAFDCCDAITSIVIPEGVTHIGESAFAACKAVTYVYIPDTVTIIEGQAFRACKALTTITIPDSVVIMGENPFRFCTSLKEIVVSPEHPLLATIDGVLFNRTNKELICYPPALEAAEYEIPDGILSIGSKAFFRCDFLTSVIIPDTVTRIGDHAFYWCPNLTGVAIPESVTSIEKYAFYDCDMLNTLTIPDSVTVIGNDAFSACDALTLTVGPESYACEYALEKGLKFTYPVVGDWLND